MTNVATDETSSLIASDKVEGTSVYNAKGEKLGSIYNFMVDKRSGEVEYAVLQFGGVLGLGSDYYPLPWDVLDYDDRGVQGDRDGGDGEVKAIPRIGAPGPVVEV